MRMFRWMMGTKRIEKIRAEELRAREGVANTSEKIREARPKWLGHVERTTLEDVVGPNEKMKDGSDCTGKIGRPKVSEGDRSTETRSESNVPGEWKLDVLTQKKELRPKKKRRWSLKSDTTGTKDVTKLARWSLIDHSTVDMFITSPNSDNIPWCLPKFPFWTCGTI